MSVMLVFLAVIAAISFRWLSHQRLASKPWLEEGAFGEFPRTGASALPAAKIGLGVFVAVAGCVFALLVSAYVMRVGPAPLNGLDGSRGPMPRLLWLNTGLLAFSGAMLHLAWIESRRGQMDLVRTDLVIAAAAALAFVAGQLLAWSQMARAGFVLAGDPANSFFYLLTGMHALHVMGGVAGLGRVTLRAQGGAAAGAMRLGVELCAIYWHFLLLVWLLLFSLLMGWTGDLVEVCRAIAR